MSNDVQIGKGQVTLAQINERSREIFRQIVESYLATGEPVGSRNISRLIATPLSPASVRNVMSDLGPDRGLELPQRACARAYACRGQGGTRESARSPEGPVRRAHPEDRR